MILVVSSVRDEHGRTVFDELARRGAAAQLLDLSRFPQELRLALRYQGDAHDFVLRIPEVGALPLADARVVW